MSAETERNRVELLSISPGSDVHQPEMKKKKSKKTEKKKFLKHKFAELGRRLKSWRLAIVFLFPFFYLFF